MGKPLTPYQICLVMSYRHPKPILSWGKIAKKLHKGKSTVFQAYKRARKRKSLTRKKGSGRPRKTTKSQDKTMVVMSKRDPFLTATNIQKDMKIPIHPRTVSRCLNENGQLSFYTTAKPYIRPKNRKKRVSWAKAHRHWKKVQWRKVLFSDESKFTVRSHSKRRVRRRKGQRLNPKYLQGKVKHDQYIMVWGCFTYNGVGRLYRIKGILEKTQYKHILRNCMKPSLVRLLGVRRGIFQQDNDPKHTSKLCKNFLEEENVNVLNWPADSPDLSPIENLWDYLEDMTKDRRCKNGDELFQCLEKAWNQIPINYLRALIDSMPERCEEVVRTKGWPTKW